MVLASCSAPRSSWPASRRARSSCSPSWRCCRGPGRVALWGERLGGGGAGAARPQFGLDRPLVAQYLDWVRGLVTFDLGTLLRHAGPDRAAGRRPAAGDALWLVVCAMLIALRGGAADGHADGRAARADLRRGPVRGVPGRRRGPGVPGGHPAGGGLRGGARLAAGERVDGARRRPGDVPAAARAAGAVRWASCRPRSSPATCAARCSTCCGRTTCAPLAPRGCARSRRCVRHGLRNAAVPVVTVLGLQLATLLIGAVVVERVFVIPGLGSLLLDCVSNRDLLHGSGRGDDPGGGGAPRELLGGPALPPDRPTAEDGSTDDDTRPGPAGRRRRAQPKRRRRAPSTAAWSSEG